MGMAASQARLLCITARIHDVEQQAQAIQNAKIQLSTQSDQVYQEYLEALDATTLTIKDWQGNTMVASVSSIGGRNAVDCGANKYAIRNDRGELVVPDDIYELYTDYMDDGGVADPYAFAMYAIDPNNLPNYPDEEAENNVLEYLKNGEEASNSTVVALTNMQESMQSLLDENGFESYEDLLNTFQSTSSDELEYKSLKELKQKYDEINQSFRFQLYNSYGKNVFNEAAGYNQEDESEFNQDDFNYYVDMFKQIQAAGGQCVSIDDYNGTDGDASNNSEWLKNMVASGKFAISMVNKDTKSGEVSFKSTAPNSDTYLGEENVSSIDKTALAKAEAKYEKDMKIIDQKDKKHDMDLSKLETERTALTTEYDSVKKVINDNIERSFGIFS